LRGEKRVVSMRKQPHKGVGGGGGEVSLERSGKLVGITNRKERLSFLNLGPGGPASLENRAKEKPSQNYEGRKEIGVLSRERGIHFAAKTFVTREHDLAPPGLGGGKTTTRAGEKR